MTDTAAILESLEPLFRAAEDNGLWFNSDYQDLWFHPKELRHEQAHGNFLWGPTNWKLRNPSERLAELELGVKVARQRADDFKQRMEQ